MQLTIEHIAGAITGVLLSLLIIPLVNLVIPVLVPALAAVLIWSISTPAGPLLAFIAIIAQPHNTPEPVVIDLADVDYLAVLLSGEVY